MNNAIAVAQTAIKNALAPIIEADQNRLREVRTILAQQDEDIVAALKNPNHVWDI
jgi:hypothetical protein